jgi:hypothetical protein
MFSSAYDDVTEPNEYTDLFGEISGYAKQCVDFEGKTKDLDSKYNGNIQAYYDYVKDDNAYHTFYIGNLIEETTDGYVYVVKTNPLTEEYYALKLTSPADSEILDFYVLPTGDTMTLNTEDGKQSIEVDIFKQVTEDDINQIKTDYEYYNQYKTQLTVMSTTISDLVSAKIPD